LYNNSVTDGILFESVFCRKSDVIHILVSHPGLGICSMLACISVILLLCVLLFLVYIVCTLSVALPDLANKDDHTTWIQYVSSIDYFACGKKVKGTFVVSLWCVKNSIIYRIVSSCANGEWTEGCFLSVRGSFCSS